MTVTVPQKLNKTRQRRQYKNKEQIYELHTYDLSETGPVFFYHVINSSALRHS